MPITGAPPDVPVSVRVARSTPQSIPDTAYTAIIFDTQRWDDPNDDQWESVTNPTRLTCRVDGLYVITANIRWASSAVGYRMAVLYMNGTTAIANTTAAIVTDVVNNQIITTTYKLVAGDFVELHVLQTSGGALNIDSAAQYSPEFSMVRCV